LISLHSSAYNVFVQTSNKRFLYTTRRKTRGHTIKSVSKRFGDISVGSSYLPEIRYDTIVEFNVDLKAEYTA